MSSNSDLLTSLDAMYEAANRRAEAAEWRDNYATGYSDGLWDARTRVREVAYGLVHLTDKIRDLADASAESEDSADATVEALIEITRLLDGDDA